MSTIEDFRSTTFAAVPYEDLTIAEAWASSPLGDPELEDGSLSGPVAPEEFPAAAATAKPRSQGTNALVAGAVVAAFGAIAGLGLMLVDGANGHKPAVVVPNSNVSSVTPQSPSAVAPPPVAPVSSTPAPAPDAGHVSPGPVSGGGAPVVIVPPPAPAAPPADWGAPPPPPNVTVNAPPVIVPVPIPIPVPPQHDGSPPAPSGHGPIQCYACHPPQPAPQPPVHPQPIHPQPLQHP